MFQWQALGCFVKLDLRCLCFEHSRLPRGCLFFGLCVCVFAGEDHGSARLSLLWGCFLPENILSIRLPVQAAELSFDNEDMLLHRELQRHDLLGYVEGAVELSTDDLPGSVV